MVGNGSSSLFLLQLSLVNLSGEYSYTLDILMNMFIQPIVIAATSSNLRYEKTTKHAH
jgi:hypothetical protein